MFSSEDLKCLDPEYFSIIIADAYNVTVMSRNKDIQVSSKKQWLSGRLEEGLVFLKSVERGKCFIEYIPAENAWVPIAAERYMYIDCLWVSGSFKGHGYSNDLLGECIRDSREKGRKGLCVLSSAKKRPFLADPKFLSHKGFTVCDTADKEVQLWHLPFDSEGKSPEFKECAKHPCVDAKGYVLFYTNQCPYTAKYVPLVERIAKERGVQFQSVHIGDSEAAQNAPTPVTNYALFFDGEYVSNEILSDKKFLKMIGG